MSKKQRKTKHNKVFTSDPFTDLKGFSASEAPQDVPAAEEAAAEPDNHAVTFAEKMQQLGVKPLSSDPLDEREPDAHPQPEGPVPPEPAGPTEDEQFLQAMSALQVRFSDQVPEAQHPPTASARRMKQLKQGLLVPQASLDLHGLMRDEVAPKLRFFLQDAQGQGWQTLLVITGKGLHSPDGEPVLRNEAEKYLASEGRQWVAEWGGAPKKYGGAGALVLFMRKK